MSNIFLDFIAKVVDGHNLTQDESRRAFQIIMNGGATPAQIAAFLVALRIKGESVSEIAGAAYTMRVKSHNFNAPDNAIDTCGTGGDATGTYNISTTTAIVVAGCGVPVVKHGNRAISSKSGSADILQHLGVNLQASPKRMQEALEQANICFLMAPNYHKAMKHIAPIRQELKLRTIFNLLGPLSNPASVKRQLIGVYDRKLLRPLAEVLRELGTEFAWIVHGADGMDELSLTGETYVAELCDGNIRELTVTPEELGLNRCTLEELQGGDPAANAKAMEQLLAGDVGAYRNIVLLNSAAALLVAGKVDTLNDGITKAAEAIDQYKARNALQQLIAITND